jgi:hypothetical protein
MAEDFSVLIHRPPVANTEECQQRQPVPCSVLSCCWNIQIISAGRRKVTRVALVLLKCFQNLFVCSQLSRLCSNRDWELQIVRTRCLLETKDRSVIGKLLSLTPIYS